MAKENIKKFQKERKKLNRLVMEYAGQGTKRYKRSDEHTQGGAECLQT